MTLNNDFFTSSEVVDLIIEEKRHEIATYKKKIVDPGQIIARDPSLLKITQYINLLSRDITLAEKQINDFELKLKNPKEKLSGLKKKEAIGKDLTDIIACEKKL